MNEKQNLELTTTTGELIAAGQYLRSLSELRPDDDTQARLFGNIAEIIVDGSRKIEQIVADIELRS